jgi:hypothetical protein
METSTSVTESPAEQSAEPDTEILGALVVNPEVGIEILDVAVMPVPVRLIVVKLAANSFETISNVAFLLPVEVGEKVALKLHCPPLMRFGV